jgi:hypothetical protein
MTAPRIVRTGAVISDGRDIEIGGGGSLHLVLIATGDESEDARALDGQRVRITVEPADATPEEAPHGSPLDYLAEAKALLNQTLDRYAVAGETDADLRRCLSLLNSARLAALNYLRRTT